MAALRAALTQIKAELAGAYGSPCPADSDEDAVLVEAPPPATPIETIDLENSSEDGEPAGSVAPPTPTTRGGGAAAREARRLKRRMTVCASATSIGQQQSDPMTICAERAAPQQARAYFIKQEAGDGGWTAEFQPLRELPFSSSEYERLRNLFFTEYNVCGGGRESRTRSGTLRVTQRITGKTTRIAEWPRLRAAVEDLHAAGDFPAALAHLRCLERYMQMVHCKSTPRIMRGESSTTTHADGVDEIVDLTETDSGEKTDVVDVETLEALLLGPLSHVVKQEHVKQHVLVVRRTDEDDDLPPFAPPSDSLVSAVASDSSPEASQGEDDELNTGRRNLKAPKRRALMDSSSEEEQDEPSASIIDLSNEDVSSSSPLLTTEQRVASATDVERFASVERMSDILAAADLEQARLIAALRTCEQRKGPTPLSQKQFDPRVPFENLSAKQMEKQVQQMTKQVQCPLLLTHLTRKVLCPKCSKELKHLQGQWDHAKAKGCPMLPVPKGLPAGLTQLLQAQRRHIDVRRGHKPQHPQVQGKRTATSPRLPSPKKHQIQMIW